MPEVIQSQDTPSVKVDNPQLQDLIDSLHSNYLAVRIEALEKLGEFQTSNDQELQAIVTALTHFRAQEFNDFEDRFADKAFAELGDPLIAEIKRLSALQDQKEVSKAATAMRALGGSKLEQFKSVLDDWLASTDTDRHWAALFVLEGLAPESKVFLPQLREQIHAEDFQTQQIALRALAELGNEAYPALAEVRELAESGQNISVKSHAAIAMGHIAKGKPEAEEVTKQLMGYLDVFYFIQKQRAMMGLIALGPDAKAAVDKAKTIMETDKSGLAPHAAYFYGLASGDWDTAIQSLDTLTSDYTYGFEALQYLHKAGKNAKPATETLLKLLVNEDESISSLAAETLATIYDKPDQDDPMFQKVLQRFAQLEDSAANESTYIAAKQVEKWKAEGINIPAPNANQ